MNSKQAFVLRGTGILGKITGNDTCFVPDKFITDYVLANGGVVYSYDASPNLFPIYKEVSQISGIYQRMQIVLNYHIAVQVKVN